MDFLSSGTKKLSSRCREVAVSEGSTVLRVLIFFLWVWFSDNTAIHHWQRVIDAINASGALLIFLPPYSLHLMPCEGVIGQAKSWIRENELVWEQCDELETMDFEAFMQIPDEEIANYIRHCEYLQFKHFIPLLLAR